MKNILENENHFRTIYDKISRIFLRNILGTATEDYKLTELVVHNVTIFIIVIYLLTG